MVAMALVMVSCGSEASTESTSTTDSTTVQTDSTAVQVDSTKVDSTAPGKGKGKGSKK